DLTNWGNEVTGGDGGYCSIQPRFPAFQTTSSQSNGVYAATKIPIYRTTNRWQSATNITLDASGDYAAFIPPHVVDPYNPSILYAASSYLYKYDDNLPDPDPTKRWSRRLGNITPPPNGSNPGTKLAGGPINDPLDPNYVVCVEIAQN